MQSSSSTVSDHSDLSQLSHSGLIELLLNEREKVSTVERQLNEAHDRVRSVEESLRIIFREYKESIKEKAMIERQFSKCTCGAHHDSSDDNTSQHNTITPMGPPPPPPPVPSPQPQPQQCNHQSTQTDMSALTSTSATSTSSVSDSSQPQHTTRVIRAPRVSLRKNSASNDVIMVSSDTNDAIPHSRHKSTLVAQSMQLLRHNPVPPAPTPIPTPIQSPRYVIRSHNIEAAAAAVTDLAATRSRAKIDKMDGSTSSSATTEEEEEIEMSCAGGSMYGSTYAGRSNGSMSRSGSYLAMNTSHSNSYAGTPQNHTLSNHSDNGNTSNSNGGAAINSYPSQTQQQQQQYSNSNSSNVMFNPVQQQQQQQQQSQSLYDDDDHESTVSICSDINGASMSTAYGAHRHSLSPMALDTPRVSIYSNDSLQMEDTKYTNGDTTYGYGMNDVNVGTTSASVSSSVGMSLAGHSAAVMPISVQIPIQCSAIPVYRHKRTLSNNSISSSIMDTSIASNDDVSKVNTQEQEDSKQSELFAPVTKGRNGSFQMQTNENSSSSIGDISMSYHQMIDSLINDAISGRNTQHSNGLSLNKFNIRPPIIGLTLPSHQSVIYRQTVPSQHTRSILASRVIVSPHQIVNIVSPNDAFLQNQLTQILTHIGYIEPSNTDQRMNTRSHSSLPSNSSSNSNSSNANRSRGVEFELGIHSEFFVYLFACEDPLMDVNSATSKQESLTTDKSQPNTNIIAPCGWKFYIAETTNSITCYNQANEHVRNARKFLQQYQQSLLSRNSEIESSLFNALPIEIALAVLWVKYGRDFTDHCSVFILGCGASWLEAFQKKQSILELLQSRLHPSALSTN